MFDSRDNTMSTYSSALPGWNEGFRPFLLRQSWEYAYIGPQWVGLESVSLRDWAHGYYDLPRLLSNIGSSDRSVVAPTLIPKVV